MKSYTVIEIEFSKLKSFCTAVSQKNITVYKVRRKGKSVFISIDIKDEKSVFAILNELCYNYKIVAKYGYGNNLKKLSKRPGLVFGLIISIVMCFFFSNTVLDIRYVGEASLHRQEVSAILEELGIKKGMFTFFLDTETIENAVTKVDGISFGQVQLKGSVLFVGGQKQLDEPDIEDTTDYSPIVAQCNGIITRVVVQSGTALVKQGQTVKAGDVLIAPYTVSQQGEETVFNPCYAKGDVYAKVYYSQSSIFYPEIITQERTGNKKTFTDIAIFGKTLSGKKEIPFENFESVVSVTKSKSIIPFEIITTTYYETQSVKIVRTFEEAYPEIINGLYEKLNIASTGDTLIKKWEIINKKGDNFVIEVFYETEKLINER